MKISRKFARRWISQGLRDLYNGISGRAITFSKIFPNWEEAARAAGNGYSSDTLLERLEKSALAVKRGEAEWEQDGVTHDDIPPDFPLLAALAQAALSNDGNLVVLDFGGAFGNTYHQCRKYLPGLKSLRWHIVEQDHIANTGKATFQTDELKFHNSIESCLAERPNITILGSVLQYLPRPYELLETIATSGMPFLFIDRHFSSMTEELITRQVIPETLYPASYPCWLFDCKKMWTSLAEEYELVFEWNGKDPPIRGRGIGATFVGAFWRRRPCRRAVLSSPNS